MWQEDNGSNFVKKKKKYVWKKTATKNEKSWIIMLYTDQSEYDWIIKCKQYFTVHRHNYTCWGYPRQSLIVKL